MTRFTDAFGRVISRDIKILEVLETEFRRTGVSVLAQAGLEIECLKKEIASLNADLEESTAALKATLQSLKESTAKPPSGSATPKK